MMSTATPTSWPATITVHCPNGPVDACEHHARALRGLMNFLGTHVGVTAAAAGAECSNCRNEAAKAGRCHG